MKDCAFCIGKRHDIKMKRGSTTPSVVTKHVCTHSFLIVGLALLGLVQLHSVEIKPKAAVVLRLINSENRTVAGLYSVVCAGAVKSSRETVFAIP